MTRGRSFKSRQEQGTGNFNCTDTGGWAMQADVLVPRRTAVVWTEIRFVHQQTDALQLVGETTGVGAAGVHHLVGVLIETGGGTGMWGKSHQHGRLRSPEMIQGGGAWLGNYVTKRPGGHCEFRVGPIFDTRFPMSIHCSRMNPRAFHSPQCILHTCQTVHWNMRMSDSMELGGVVLSTRPGRGEDNEDATWRGRTLIFTASPPPLGATTLVNELPSVIPLASSSNGRGCF